MGSDTKEKIRQTSLELFAKNGYAGTSVADIAGALGLAKSALYKHYPSKEAIWDAIWEQGEAHYAAHFGSPGSVPLPRTGEEFTALTMRQVEFTVRDTLIRQFRQIMATEQFRDPRVSALATKHYITSIEAFYAPLFAEMMEQGILRKSDPAMLALSYTAPISLLIGQCDREPADIDKMIEKIRRYAVYFADEWIRG